MTSSSFKFALTATDYPTLVNEARRYATQLMPDWDFDSNADIGRFALDIFLRAQVQYIELSNGWAQEGFLSSARLRSSAIAHAVSRGYTPRNPVPSIGRVSLQFQSSPVPVNIPQFSIQLSTRNIDRSAPVFFENTESFTLPANTQNISQEFVAGESQTDSYTGTGQFDQSVRLAESPVIDKSVTISDSLGQVWTQVDDFVDSSPLNRHFTVTLQSDSTSLLSFGDNSNGLVVQNLLVLTIKYRIGGGLNTNVVPNAVKTVERTPTPIVLCTNLAKMANGDDAEPLPSIKKNAPAAFRRRDILARVEEVVSYSEAYPGVSRAYAQLVSNTVLVSVIPKGGGQASTALKNSLTADLDRLLIMGYLSQVDDAVYQTVSVSVVFTTRKGFDSREIENEIAKEILEYLDPTAVTSVDGKEQFTRQFGEPLRVNNIRAIMQRFAETRSIESDFAVTAPAADTPTVANAIFSNVGSTVQATSTNTLTIQYKL